MESGTLTASYPRAIFRGVGFRSVNLTIHLHLVLKFRTMDTLPPRSIYAFMAWCLDTGVIYRRGEYLKARGLNWRECS